MVGIGTTYLAATQQCTAGLLPNNFWPTTANCSTCCPLTATTTNRWSSRFPADRYGAEPQHAYKRVTVQPGMARQIVLVSLRNQTEGYACCHRIADRHRYQRQIARRENPQAKRNPGARRAHWRLAEPLASVIHRQITRANRMTLAGH